MNIREYGEQELEIDRLEHGLDQERELREKAEWQLDQEIERNDRLEKRIRELEDKLVEVYERSKNCERLP